MRRAVVVIAVLAAASLPVSGPVAEEPPRPHAPVMTLLGSYGDPLRLAVQGRRIAAALPAIAVDLPVEHAAGAGVRAVPMANLAITALPVRAGSAEPEFEIKDRDSDLAPPVEPGTLRQGPMRVPSAYFKNQLVAPRVTPDVKLLEAGGATVGMFGEVGKVDIDRTGALPNVKAHDLGGGLTLQYKFGS